MRSTPARRPRSCALHQRPGALAISATSCAPRDLPVGELLAAHLQQAASAHATAGDPAWIDRATQELITLLRDDYPTLMSVLGALADDDPQRCHSGGSQ